MCTCGLESNGPPEFDDAGRLLRPLYGRIATTPAHRVELIVDEDLGTAHISRHCRRVAIPFSSAATDDFDLYIDFRVRFEFSWSDEVENISGRDASLQLLYHFNIGQRPC